MHWKPIIGARQGLFKRLVAETGVRQEEEAEVVRAPSTSVQAQVRDNKECGTRLATAVPGTRTELTSGVPASSKDKLKAAALGFLSCVSTFFLLVSSFSENSK